MHIFIRWNTRKFPLHSDFTPEHLTDFNFNWMLAKAVFRAIFSGTLIAFVTQSGFPDSIFESVHFFKAFEHALLQNIEVLLHVLYFNYTFNYKSRTKQIKTWQRDFDYFFKNKINSVRIVCCNKPTKNAAFTRKI